MLPTRASVVIAAVLAAVVAASTAQGASIVRPWLAGHGSWSTYSMTDVNREDIGGFVDGVNAELELPWDVLSMDEIRNGFGFGLDAGVDLGKVSFGVGYERLLASTTSAAELFLPLEGLPKIELGYKVPATAFRALAEYRLPTHGPLGARLGIAAGSVSVAGGASATVSVSSLSQPTYTGKGPLFEAYGCGEWWAAPRFALSASLGYRHARVRGHGALLIEQNVLWKFPDLWIDYSGVVARMGFKLALK
jgi:hypothetical protein